MIDEKPTLDSILAVEEMGGDADYGPQLDLTTRTFSGSTGSLVRSRT